MAKTPSKTVKRQNSNSTNGWVATKAIFLKAISAGPFATVTICVTAITLSIVWTLGSINLATVILKILDGYALGVGGWVLFAGALVALNVNRRRHTLELGRITAERNDAQSKIIPVSSSIESPKLSLGTTNVSH